MLDQLPVKYTSYTKVILKECTQGFNGRIEKYFPLYATSANSDANFYITKIFNGLREYDIFMQTNRTAIMPMSI